MATCPEMCGLACAELGQGTVLCSYPRFGIRSYLHHFYEECSASMRECDEDFQTKRSPSRWSPVFWKVSLAFATLILSAGLVLLMASYTISPKLEDFGEGQLLFVDSSAASFNHGLHVSRLMGAALFCAGGGLLSGALLLFTFAKGQHQGEQRLNSKATERPVALQSTGRAVTRAPSAGAGTIPVTLSKGQNAPPSL